MPTHRRHIATLTISVIAVLSAAAPRIALAQQPLLMPLASTSGTTPPTPWRAVGLPPGKAPLARFDVVNIDGVRALRLQTDSSYGTLAHEISDRTSVADATLKWRWRLDQPLAKADLRIKDGDDAALKVCVMYDMPLAQVPFVERNLLRLARSLSKELLPTATVCYVWDPGLSPGTALPNAYSRRVRYLITDGPEAAIGQWQTRERRTGADFLQLFGDESAVVPRILAVVVGADADNTAGSSLGYITDLTLVPQPGSSGTK